MIASNNPFNLRCGDDQFGFDGRFRLGLLGCTDGYYAFTNLKYGVRAALRVMMIDLRRRGLKSGQSLIPYFIPFELRSTFYFFVSHCYNDRILYKSFICNYDYALFASLVWCFLQNEIVNHVSFIESVINEFDLRIWKQ